MLNISDTAKLVDRHPQTLRDYEKAGIIPPARRDPISGWRVYDRYLKANRVEEGVRSYGAVVTLILRARFEPGWVPVRRAAARAPGF